MRVLILYFSGTGNTNYIAQYIEKHLKSCQCIVETKSIEQIPPQQVEEYDLLIVGFPVYACNAPLFVQKYLKDMPNATSKGLFLFDTKGIYSGNALRNAAKLLASKGYILLGCADVTMPGSDGLAFMSKTSSFVKKLSQKNYDSIKPVDEMIGKIQDIADKINKGESLEKYNQNLNPNIAGLLVGGLFALVYKPFENNFRKKFWADEKCVRCKLCGKICPSGNIKVDETSVHFGNKCYLCMRCIHQCPKEAIQIGKGTIGKFRWKGPSGDFKPLFHK